MTTNVITDRNDFLRNNIGKILETNDPGNDPTQSCNNEPHNLVFAETDASDGKYPNMIQICPWFLQYMIPRKRDMDCTKIKPLFKALIARFVDDKMTQSLSFTGIDLFSLPDKVLLHAVTHKIMFFGSLTNFSREYN